MPAPDRAAGLLGMAARAGALVLGTERVRAAARAGSVRLVLLARDASHNSRSRLQPLLEARGINYVTRFNRAALGDAVGRAPLSAIGVIDAAFAGRLEELLHESARR
jgi:ribosomal protein L7Ae-like RNA K-turn-binding protein